jgi:hypothetical protein
VPAQITDRPFTDAEKAQLQRILAAVPSRPQQLKAAVRQLFLFWAFSFLAGIVVWLLAAAIAKALLGVAFGWGSPHVTSMFVGVLALSLLFSAVFTVRWFHSMRGPELTLRKDLAAGQASEEVYAFSAVKRFQEQEHGGLMYFLKSSDEASYVMFDTESQQLGAQGRDPLGSSFRPRTALRIVRTPLAKLVLTSEFSGEELAPPAPIALKAAMSAWPQPDAPFAERWDALETRFGQ